MNHDFSKHGDPATVFADLYETGTWENGTPGSSGNGSGDAERKPYVDAVVRLLRETQAKSVVDLGCGDGRVLADISHQHPQATYLGVDCYGPHVEALRRKLPHHSWVQGDLLRAADDLRADVCLCKDVLHHWPNAVVTGFLREVKRLKPCKTLVLCFDRNQRFDGETCALGGYRALNPDWRPFRDAGLPVLFRQDFLHKTILTARLD